MSTDAHFWMKIGFKFQSLGKISNILTSDPPVLLGQFQHCLWLAEMQFPTVWGLARTLLSRYSIAFFIPPPSHPTLSISMQIWTNYETHIFRKRGGTVHTTMPLCKKSRIRVQISRRCGMLKVTQHVPVWINISWSYSLDAVYYNFWLTIYTALTVTELTYREQKRFCTVAQKWYLQFLPRDAL